MKKKELKKNIKAMGFYALLGVNVVGQRDAGLKVEVKVSSGKRCYWVKMDVGYLNAYIDWLRIKGHEDEARGLEESLLTNWWW